MGNKTNVRDDHEAPVARRGFFGELAREIIRPAIETWEAFREPDRATPAAQPDTLDYRSLMRPPSVRSEATFLEACDRSGECVQACPANAIRLFPEDESRVAGTPFIEVETSPCVVCQDLACMSACPSGALEPRPVEQLDLGLARVDHDVCLRSHEEDCHRCIDACPLHELGHTVLDVLMSGALHVYEDACVGCGCCQRICPTTPRAIRVEPTVRIGIA